MSSSELTDLAALQRADRDHHLHPFTDFKALGAAGTRVIVKGEGVYIIDQDGKIAHTSVGFNPNDTKIKDTIEKLLDDHEG